jgi:hypothetical protein
VDLQWCGDFMVKCEGERLLLEVTDGLRWGIVPTNVEIGEAALLALSL